MQSVIAKRRQTIEAALERWREAERRLADGDGPVDPNLIEEIERARDEYQRIAGAHMAERIDALRDADRRRQAETPSTGRYHVAAGEVTVIANEIWGDARSMDEDTPRRR